MYHSLKHKLRMIADIDLSFITTESIHAILPFLIVGLFLLQAMINQRAFSMAFLINGSIISYPSLVG